MFEHQLTSLLSRDADPVAAGWQLRELADASIEKAPLLLEQLAQLSSQAPTADPAILGGLIRVLHTTTLQPGGDVAEVLDFDQLRELTSKVPESTPNRHLLLQLAASIRTQESLNWLVDCLIESPPTDWINAAQSVSPLMKYNDWPIAAVFPRVFDALQHPSLASTLLDLANYLYRSGRIDQHPASGRETMLNALLGEVTGRLAQFEENPRVFGDDVTTVQTRLGEAVALAVSLCDSVGLLGDESAISKLNQTIELKHRRVQCEAAGALARLGDDPGKKRLIELAAEPSARLRAIHYADELHFGELIDEKYRSDEATAEAEMTLWLSQPAQMGVPPTSVEVVHRKRMLWPSFNDPVDILLVRFEYNFGERIYSNVGVTGPVTFALGADVADLPMNDIYAIYAGWHADHPEIFVVPSEQLNEAQVRVMRSLSEHLERSEFESLKPALLGIFLDEKAGVFEATRDGKPCLVVSDGLETIEQPTSGRLRPLSAIDLFNLYKGRKMLRTFNNEIDSDSESDETNELDSPS
ncbi:HEAT repeat domain-containing protein [Rubripirellula amarantea]|nr:HEAT repeat domain-containing protein [Rubripirellula amarantea]